MVAADVRRRLAATRSFFDPNSDTDENPTDYTKRVKPGDLFAIDNLKVRVGDEWVRVMSDSDNEENGSADGFEEPKAMRKGNPLRGSERQCAKIMARVERKREPERSVPRILAIVTSYRRWVVLLHNHSISLLLL